MVAIHQKRIPFASSIGFTTPGIILEPYSSQNHFNKVQMISENPAYAQKRDIRKHRFQVRSTHVFQQLSVKVGYVHILRCFCVLFARVIVFIVFFDFAVGKILYM